MRYLANAFAVQMVPNGGTIDITPCNWDREFIKTEKFRSCVLTGRKSIIGHADLAAVLGVEFNRESIELLPGDDLLVAQVMGGRLPEGCTVLPPGIEIKFFFVQIQQPDVPVGRPLPGSIYGGIMKAADDLAAKHGGAARAMNDPHGNFIAEIEAPGLYARLWDD